MYSAPSGVQAVVDVLVIGAGHCGLMSGYLLGQRGLSYVIVDRAAKVGDVWRQRPHHLHLFTSRKFCALADTRVPGDQNGFPSTLEFADYLTWFAQDKQLIMHLNATIVEMHSLPSGGWQAGLANGNFIFAKAVIDATGSNQNPIRPVFADALAKNIRQLHAGEFANGEVLQTLADQPIRRVLVVGDGTSGRQLAMHLARRVPEVFLACGKTRRAVPLRFLGRDILWWMQMVTPLLNLYCRLTDNRVRQKMLIPYECRMPAVIAAGVRVRPRVVAAEGESLTFAGGESLQPDVVIWAMGYQESNPWQAPLPEKGVYVVGRKWLSCQEGQLMLNITRDVSQVVEKIERWIQSMHLHAEVINER